mmetsp:Transcript_46950/g.124771  ORF Transcript_46950/g.124771 Transcript_46950/m.124771 type:complete len:278 (-) Transcript_46950:51-884(-)
MIARPRSALNQIAVLLHVCKRAELCHTTYLLLVQIETHELGNAIHLSRQVFLQILVLYEKHTGIFSLCQETSEMRFPPAIEQQSVHHELSHVVHIVVRQVVWKTKNILVQGSRGIGHVPHNVDVTCALRQDFVRKMREERARFELLHLGEVEVGNGLRDIDELRQVNLGVLLNQRRIPTQADHVHNLLHPVRPALWKGAHHDIVLPEVRFPVRNSYSCGGVLHSKPKFVERNPWKGCTRAGDVILTGPNHLRHAATWHLHPMYLHTQVSTHTHDEVP